MTTRRSKLPHPSVSSSRFSGRKPCDRVVRLTHPLSKASWSSVSTNTMFGWSAGGTGCGPGGGGGGVGGTGGGTGGFGGLGVGGEGEGEGGDGGEGDGDGALRTAFQCMSSSVYIFIYIYIWRYRQHKRPALGSVPLRGGHGWVASLRVRASSTRVRFKTYRVVARLVCHRAPNPSL